MKGKRLQVGFIATPEAKRILDEMGERLGRGGKAAFINIAIEALYALLTEVESGKGEHGAMRRALKEREKR